MEMPEQIGRNDSATNATWVFLGRRLMFMQGAIKEGQMTENDSNNSNGQQAPQQPGAQQPGFQHTPNAQQPQQPGMPQQPGFQQPIPSDAATAPHATNSTIPNAAGPAQGNAPSPEKKKKSKWKIVVIVIVALAVLGLIGQCGSPQNQSGGTSQSSNAASTQQSAQEDEAAKQQAEQAAQEERERQEAQAIQTARNNLQVAVDRCAAYLAEDWTPESFQALTTSLALANETLANANSTAAELTSAQSAVEAAEAGLAQAFKPENYAAVAYTDVARNPDSYMGQKLVFTGKVLQVVEGTTEIDIRIATDGAYDDVVFVGYSPDLLGGTRVLEDDSVTVYGTCVGLYTYTSTLGASISLPGMYADQVVIN